MEIIQTTHSQIELGDIQKSSFQQVLQAYNQQKKVIVVDENTHDTCLEYLITTFPELEKAEIILLPAGEENKVMEVCFQVWQAFTEYKIERKDLVINLGGGVVTDMGGFIASVYKRGLKFINVPTSLLAMVDAAIGGKTGIDLDGYKNQLGTFSHPTHVYIDPLFLGTLPEEEIFNGYAEMLKHALISSRETWDLLSTIHSEEDLVTLENIKRSVLIKTNIVDSDPEEKGVRKLLNFGHTIGHALESYFLMSTPISHGHAVALGMVAESFISWKKGMLTEHDFRAIETSITASFPMIFLEPDAVQNVVNLLHQDKKNEQGRILSTLLSDIGVGVYNQEITEEEAALSLLHLSILHGQLN